PSRTHSHSRQTSSCVPRCSAHSLHDALPIFTPPLVVASEQALANPELADNREALQRAGVELVNSGNGTATEIVQALSARGLNRIVCEGGPGIFGLFITDKMLDQLYLTLDPTLTTDVEKNLVSAKASSTIGI